MKLLTKKNKIRILKFNMDKSLDEINGDIEKSIILYEKEGWEANPKCFTELNKDKYFGFKHGNVDKLLSCFVVRENDPSPLHFVEDSIFGDPVTPEDLVYHEDESFSRKVSEIELNKGKAKQNFVVFSLGIVSIILAASFLIGMFIVGIPSLNFGGS